MYPAWRASRVDVASSLREESGSAGTYSNSRWTAAKLVVLAQVTTGMVLVTAAVLFTGHLNEMVNRETGLDRGHILLFDVRPGEIGYSDARLRHFYFNMEQRLRELPGVQYIGLSRIRPMMGGGTWDTVRLAGSTKGAQSAVHNGTSSFLSALGISIVAGRAPTEAEIRSGMKVAVVSENLAGELGLASPLGAQIARERDSYEIVGVARQSRYSGMGQERRSRGLPPVAYLPFDYNTGSATVVMRTSVPPHLLTSAVKDTMNEIDRGLPLQDVFTMEQQISRTLRRERLFAWLCGSFGVLALVLCAVGLYGLLSHITARRTPEIGIRIALGASRRDLILQVLGEGMRLSAVGLAFGVPLALFTAQIAGKQKLLPEGPLPVWMLAAAVGLISAAALIAVLPPAIRAASIDPMKAIHR